MQRIAIAPIRADINVTPLVDVVLVLLIIFMVVTPLFTDRVRLPSTDHPALRPEHTPRHLVTLEEDRTVRIDGALVAPAEFRERLKRIFAEAPTSEVVVKADAHLSYGDVKRALLDVRDAGFGRVGLITTPRAERAGTRQGAATL